MVPIPNPSMPIASTTLGRGSSMPTIWLPKRRRSSMSSSSRSERSCRECADMTLPLREEKLRVELEGETER